MVQLWCGERNEALCFTKEGGNEGILFLCMANCVLFFFSRDNFFLFLYTQR